jgi:glyoxylase-like metal-dependent hydrolase (beta-lactamase superfamily II)
MCFALDEERALFTGDHVMGWSTTVVSPLIRRVVAHNPSKYTYHGTGTYIVGHGDVTVIDPGPQLDAHRDALAAALAGDQSIPLALLGGGLAEVACDRAAAPPT